jgi:tetratricopeptide (TPR) repeat protein
MPIDAPDSGAADGAAAQLVETVKPRPEPSGAVERHPSAAVGVQGAEDGGFETREAFAAWCDESTNSADWHEAILRWRRFRQAYPADAWGFVREAIALVNIGAFSQGMELLQAAEREFPKSEVVDLGFAEAAMSQRDYDRAAALWEKLREEHPEVPWGYTGAVKVQLEIGQFEQAEKRLKEFLAAFPDNSTGLVDYARCAQQRGDWSEALSRWRKVISSYPEIIWGHLGEAGILISTGRMEEAQTAISTLEVRFSTAAAPYLVKWAAEMAAAPIRGRAERVAGDPAFGGMAAGIGAGRSFGPGQQPVAEAERGLVRSRADTSALDAFLGKGDHRSASSPGTKSPASAGTHILFDISDSEHLFEIVEEDNGFRLTPEPIRSRGERIEAPAALGSLADQTFNTRARDLVLQPHMNHGNFPHSMANYVSFTYRKDDFALDGVDPKAIVDGIFWRVLKRRAEESAIARFGGALQAGVPAEDILRMVLCSEEAREIGVTIEGIDAAERTLCDRVDGRRNEFARRHYAVRQLLAIDSAEFRQVAFRTLLKRSMPPEEAKRPHLIESDGQKVIYLFDLALSDEARSMGIELTGLDEVGIEMSFLEIQRSFLLYGGLRSPSPNAETAFMTQIVDDEDEVQMVFNAYHYILGRNPEVQGLTRHVTILRTRRVIARDVMKNIAASEEARLRGVTLIDDTLL